MLFSLKVFLSLAATLARSSAVPFSLTTHPDTHNTQHNSQLLRMRRSERRKRKKAGEIYFSSSGLYYCVFAPPERSLFPPPLLLLAVVFLSISRVSPVVAVAVQLLRFRSSFDSPF